LPHDIQYKTKVLAVECLEHVGLHTLKFCKGDGWYTACCKMLLFCARTIPID